VIDGQPTRLVIGGITPLTLQMKDIIAAAAGEQVIALATPDFIGPAVADDHIITKPAIGIFDVPLRKDDGVVVSSGIVADNGAS
jgi:hypothetical protein